MIEFAQTKRGDITIRIPGTYLRHAVSIHDGLPEGSRVTNTKIFSDEVLRGLKMEEEDGSNPIHLMIDRVIDRITEDGAEGIKLPADDE